MKKLYIDPTSDQKEIENRLKEEGKKSAKRLALLKYEKTELLSTFPKYYRIYVEAKNIDDCFQIGFDPEREILYTNYDFKSNFTESEIMTITSRKILIENGVTLPPEKKKEVSNYNCTSMLSSSLVIKVGNDCINKNSSDNFLKQITISKMKIKVKNNNSDKEENNSSNNNNITYEDANQENNENANHENNESANQENNSSNNNNINSGDTNQENNENTNQNHENNESYTPSEINEKSSEKSKEENKSNSITDNIKNWMNTPKPKDNDEMIIECEVENPNLQKLMMSYFTYHFEKANKTFAFLISKSNLNNEKDGVLKTTKETTDLSHLMRQYPCRLFNDNSFINEQDFQEYNSRFSRLPKETLIYYESKNNNNFPAISFQVDRSISDHRLIHSGTNRIGLIVMSSEEDLIYEPKTAKELEVSLANVIAFKEMIEKLKVAEEQSNVPLIVLNIDSKVDKFYEFPIKQKILNELDYAQDLIQKANKEANEAIQKATELEQKVTDAEQKAIKALAEANEERDKRIHIEKEAKAKEESLKKEFERRLAEMKDNYENIPKRSPNSTSTQDDI